MANNMFSTECHVEWWDPPNLAPMVQVQPSWPAWWHIIKKVRCSSASKFCESSSNLKAIRGDARPAKRFWSGQVVFLYQRVTGIKLGDTLASGWMDLRLGPDDHLANTQLVSFTVTESIKFKTHRSRLNRERSSCYTSDQSSSIILRLSSEILRGCLASLSPSIYATFFTTNTQPISGTMATSDRY